MISGDELIYTDPHAGERPTRSRRRLKALGAIGTALVLMAAVVAALGFTVQGRGEQYQAALTLLSRKEYGQAADILEALGDFRDSASLLQALEQDLADYEAALDLMARAEGSEAQSQSRNRLTPADPEASLRLWTQAAEALEALGDFANAKDLALQCRRSIQRIALEMAE